VFLPVPLVLEGKIQQWGEVKKIFSRNLTFQGEKGSRRRYFSKKNLVTFFLGGKIKKVGGGISPPKQLWQKH